MKSLSVVVTLLLMVMANQLAARMRKSGSLPVAKVAAERPAPAEAASSLGNVSLSNKYHTTLRP